MSSDLDIPLMPELTDLPAEMRELPTDKLRRFAWAYVLGDGEASSSARWAGYSDVKEGAKVRGHHALHRDDVQAAMRALASRYLFSLAPKALIRLHQVLDDPKHSKHLKAIELALAANGLGARTAVDVNVSGTVTLNHTDEAVEQLRTLLDLGVPRAKLEEIFGFSGLGRYERMLAEQQGKRLPTPVVIDGTATEKP